MSCKEKEVNAVFAICGKANSGKDALANALFERLNALKDNKVITGDVRILSFASPVKDILATTFGVPVAVLNMLKRTDDTIEVFGVKSTMRQVLQRFATDACQAYFGKEVWAKMLCDKIEETDFVIIPDCRFATEMDMLDETFGIERVISIKIESEDTDDHVSENDLVNKPDRNFDYVFNNVGHTLDLDKAAAKVIEGYLADIRCNPF